MPQILLTGQLKEKPPYRVLCLYSSFVHALHKPGTPWSGNYKATYPIFLFDSQCYILPRFFIKVGPCFYLLARNRITLLRIPYISDLPIHIFFNPLLANLLHGIFLRNWRKTATWSPQGRNARSNIRTSETPRTQAMSGTSTTAWRPATTESPAKTLATARIPTTQIQRMRELKATFELALQRHCTKSSKQIFPEMKLPGLVPNSCIHESVSDLYSQDLSVYFAAAK